MCGSLARRKQLLDRFYQMFGFHRLDHANLESIGKCPFPILRASEARQRHRKHIGLRDDLANSADKFVAVDGRHADVAEQDLRRVVGNLGEGFQVCMVKPVEPDRLVEAIRQMLPALQSQYTTSS